MMDAELKETIDICICTYNREMYLRLCVGALLPQLLSGSCRLTIVDNHSTDGTKVYAQALENENALVSYRYEPQQGLSNARNKAWNSSACEWIFYLDDDCLPKEDLLTEALQLIDHHKTIDAFGGPIVPIFRDKVPDWLPEGFGQFTMPFENFVQLDTGFIRGGCFLIRRKVLEMLGGFDTNLGVKGNELHYGEEIELQVRMREVGFKIGYAPSLKTEHFVRTDKLKLRWILRSEYARRRDKMFIDPISLPRATFHFCRTLIGRLIWTPIHLCCLVTSKSYSPKRAAYDILKPLFYSAGEWMGVANFVRYMKPRANLRP